MKNQTIMQNVHKIVYLINEYPKKNIKDIASLFNISPLDLNAAIWLARDLGYIIPNGSDKSFIVDTVPPKWEFGNEVKDLVDTLVYTFEHLAKDEEDIEDTILGNLTQGYAAQDVMIAVKFLINRKVLSEYIIKDGKEEYTFYTLIGNIDKQWGRKQFKKPPKSK